MIRRLSTKWVLTALAAVVLPFLGFAWYVDKEVAKWNATYVQYDLLSIAGEMAERPRQRDPRARARHRAVGGDPAHRVDDRRLRRRRDPFKSTLQGGFDQFIRTRRYYDLLLAIDANGKVIASNTEGPDGQKLSQDVYDAIAAHDFAVDDWFRKALGGEPALIDHHRSDLLPPRNTAPGSHPENYHIGFAVPVRSQLDPRRSSASCTG
jgi:hypothetical protein